MTEITHELVEEAHCRYHERLGICEADTYIPRYQHENVARQELWQFLTENGIPKTQHYLVYYLVKMDENFYKWLEEKGNENRHDSSAD